MLCAHLEGPEVSQRPLPPLPVADGLQHGPGGRRGVGQDFHGGGSGPAQQVSRAAAWTVWLSLHRPKKQEQKHTT